MQNYLQKYGFYCAIDMNAYGVYGKRKRQTTRLG